MGNTDWLTLALRNGFLGSAGWYEIESANQCAHLTAAALVVLFLLDLGTKRSQILHFFANIASARFIVWAVFRACRVFFLDISLASFQLLFESYWQAVQENPNCRVTRQVSARLVNSLQTPSIDVNSWSRPTGVDLEPVRLGR